MTDNIMNTPCFAYHSSVDRHLDCFHSLAINHSATMNIHVPVPVLNSLKF